MPGDFYCEQALSGKTALKIVRETAQVLAFYHTKANWASAYSGCA